MAIDLSSMSSQELDALMLAAAEQKKRKLREKIGEVRRKVIALAKDEGYTIDELFGSAKPSDGERKKVEPKYRNSANPSETWSGRGRRPRWMEALIATGKKQDDFKIA